MHINFIRGLLLSISLICLPLAAKSQDVNINSNLLYDATGTINLGAEFRLGNKYTLQVPLSYNPWEFGDTYWKHFLAQPEVRYWFCRSFNGSFIGAHVHFASFNVGNIGFIDKLKNHRYQGELYGAGLSYGYQWILNDRWSLEATAGAGYARINYRKYPTGCCGIESPRLNHNYWGITKLGLTLIFFIY